MPPNAHACILTQSVKPEAFQVSKLYDVSGRVAIVTGAGTGLGLVTATALAENGCRVYISGRRLEPLLEAAKFQPTKGEGRIIPIQADLNGKEGITAFRKAVEEKEKFVNILVNNHGVYLSDVDLGSAPQTAEGISKAAWEAESFETWNNTYSINVSSVYFTTMAFLPLLAAAKEVGGHAEPGCVVNISSVSGLTRTSQAGQFSYNSSKGGLTHLSDMMATEFARRGLGIRVNAICPGYFPSGMSTSDFEQFGWAPNDHWRDKYGIPFKRVGNALDYAQCMIGIITNQYMTGNTLVIDGGWLLQMAM